MLTRMSRLGIGTCLAVGLLVVLILLISSSVTLAQSGGNTMTISGNSAVITFTASFTPTSPIRVVWGVSGQPLVEQFICFASGHTQTVSPPTGTVSLLFNMTGVTVDTTFRQLTADGWYEVPTEARTMTISGNTTTVTFTASFTPTSPIRVVWGVSSQPLVEQFLTFTNTRTLTVHPPVGTVSMLFNNTGMTVLTSFRQLTADGWYEVPFSMPTPTATPSPSPSPSPTPSQTPSPTPTVTPTPTATVPPPLEHRTFLPIVTR